MNYHEIIKAAMENADKLDAESCKRIVEIINDVAEDFDERCEQATAALESTRKPDHDQELILGDFVFDSVGEICEIVNKMDDITVSLAKIVKTLTRAIGEV